MLFAESRDIMKVIKEQRKLKYIFILFCLQHLYVASDKIVTTTSGDVQGISLPPPHSKVEAFLGVPFAEPPVGPLRFRKPIPKSPSSGTYVASSKGPPCMQTSFSDIFNLGKHFPFFIYNPNMTEDCLYLNLWVPNFDDISQPKPILVWMFGGGFVGGSSDLELWDGAALAARGDFIVMTFNFRLGFLGMFTTFTDDAPGNLIYRDQILAIKWIKANAGAFGGDPDRITVGGHSSGATSVSVLLLSPLTRNLFNNAIIMSGSVINKLYYDENNERLQSLCSWFSNITGCSNSSFSIISRPDAVTQCLSQLPVEELIEAEKKINKLKYLAHKLRIGDELMPSSPTELYRSKKFHDAKALVGVSKDDGTFFMSAMFNEYIGLYDDDHSRPFSKSFTKNCMRLIAKVLGAALAKDAVQYYMNFTENGTWNTIDALSNFIGDLTMVCPTVFNADYFSLKNDIYFYKFSHRSSTSPFATWIGAIHGEDTAYFFRSVHALGANLTSEEAQLSDRMMDRWAAFIKNGNPNIPGATKWPTYSFDKPRYLNIDIKDSVGSEPLDRRCDVWRETHNAVVEKLDKNDEAQ